VAQHKVGLEMVGVGKLDMRQVEDSSRKKRVECRSSKTEG
jgi:hypothetical protein